MSKKDLAEMVAETLGRSGSMEDDIRALLSEVGRLAKICEQLQFGGRPDCPECFTASTNYDPTTRDWACGPCDNGRG